MRKDWISAGMHEAAYVNVYIDALHDILAFLHQSQVVGISLYPSKSNLG